MQDEPDFYSFVELEPVETIHDRRATATSLQQDNGATWWRLTEVSETYPNDPYPHGLYLEGWRERPREQPPFNFPLTAALTQGKD